jgi:hypothetical protein
MEDKMKGMQKAMFVLFLITAASFSGVPTKESLISAWESETKNDPQVSKFEKIDSNTYNFCSSYFPYQGKLRILNASIQNFRISGEYSHRGVIEIDCPDSSREYFDKLRQSYNSWVYSQNMYYNNKANKWLSTKEYQTKASSGPSILGTLLSGYGFWIILLGLFVWFYVYSGRKTKKIFKQSKEMMDEAKIRNEKFYKTMESNEENRKNAQERQKESIELLKEILEELKAIRQKAAL